MAERLIEGLETALLWFWGGAIFIVLCAVGVFVIVPLNYWQARKLKRATRQT